MAEKLSKLIRSGDFSDQDLAHFDKLQVADFVPLAFTEPIETNEPARVTFIVVRRGAITPCRLVLLTLILFYQLNARAEAKRSEQHTEALTAYSVTCASHWTR